MKQRTFSFAIKENLFNFKKAFTWKKTLQWLKETIKTFEPSSLVEWIQSLNTSELSIIKDLNNLKACYFLLNLTNEQKRRFLCCHKDYS